MLLGLSLVMAGCGEPRDAVPPTFKVVGTVKYAGGSPVAGGAIQFTPVADTSFAVSGDIADDGSFTMSTVKGNTRVTGAPEGEYRVVIQPPIPADHRAVPAITLPKTVRVEAKDNTFSFDVAPPAPGRKP